MVGGVKSPGLRRLLKRRWRGFHSRFASAGRRKVFCIGRNKTGTTSLVTVLQDMGFVVCNQGEPKLLVKNWLEGDIDAIVRYCTRAQVFNDLPFNLPGVYPRLAAAYPNALFVHTVRSSAEEWYESNKRYMTKRYASPGKPLTIEDLRRADYVYPGWVGETYPVIHGVAEDNLFDKPALLDHYNSYNAQVLGFFRTQSTAKFISINVAEPRDFRRLVEFLAVETTLTGFPHTNKSR